MEKHITQFQLFRSIAVISLLLFIAITAVSTFYLSTKAPWLGIKFATDATFEQNSGSTGLQITHIDPASPLVDQLEFGQRISRISNNSTSLEIHPLMFGHYDHLAKKQNLSNFFQAKAIAYRLLTGKDILIKQDDRTISFSADKDKPTESLHWTYWFTFLIGLGSLLIACRTCTKQPTLIKLGFSFVIGFGIYATVLSQLLLQRDIALGEYYFPLLVISEAVTASTVLIAVIILLALYPVTLFPKKTLTFLFILLTLFMLNDYLEWIVLPFHSFYLFLIVLTSIILYRFLLIDKWKIQIGFSLLSVLVLAFVNYLFIAGLEMHPALSLALSGLLVASLYFLLRDHLLRSLQTQSATKAENGKNQMIHDIHDTVGASLITLMNQMSSPQDVERVQTVIQTLRDTIRLSSVDSESYLEDVLADSHSEARQRAELADCSLEWSFYNKQASPYPPEKTAVKLNESITLANIIREAISNALKHGQPQLIQCTISLINKKIHILIRNDGRVSDPENWHFGFGLRNMKARVEHLGGSFSIGLIPKEGTPKKVALMVVFPISK